MRSIHSGVAVVVAIVLTSVVVAGAAGVQRGGGAMAMGHEQHADMQLFHALFARRAEITREITLRPDGVESLTESGSPDVAEMLYAHVESMIARVKEARPIHQRDPLFREIVRNASRINAQYERTPKGIRVVETSSDAYVVKLIQAHAEIVTAFITNGHAEMMKNHAVPSRETPGTP